MQPITLQPAGKLSMEVFNDQVSMFDKEGWGLRGTAFRSHTTNAPYWLCQEQLKDQDGRNWQTIYCAVPDDFGNLIEVPH